MGISHVHMDTWIYASLICYRFTDNLVIRLTGRHGVCIEANGVIVLMLWASQSTVTVILFIVNLLLCLTYRLSFIIGMYK